MSAPFGPRAYTHDSIMLPPCFYLWMDVMLPLMSDHTLRDHTQTTVTFGNFNIIRLNHGKLLVFDYCYIKRNGDFGLEKTDKMTLIRGTWGHTLSAAQTVG